jgi:hypothetical protein
MQLSFPEKPPIVSFSKILNILQEPEGSLPCSRKPSTGPYPEPDQTSPYHPIVYL